MIKLHKFCMAAAVALSAGVSFAVDVYRNDFSTRTSDQPLPGDRWFSYTYDPSATLYHNYGGKVLMDNIVVTAVPGGGCIIVR